MDRTTGLIDGTSPEAFSRLFLEHRTLVEFQVSDDSIKAGPDPRDRNFARFRGLRAGRRYWSAFRRSTVDLVMDHRFAFVRSGDAEGYLRAALPTLSEGLPSLRPVGLGDGGYSFGGDLLDLGVLYMFVFRVNNVIVKVAITENYYARNLGASPALQWDTALMIARACEQQVLGRSPGPLTTYQTEPESSAAEVPSMRLRHKQLMGELAGPVGGLAMSADGSQLLFHGSDRRLWVWDTEQLQPIRALEDVGGTARALTCSADGSWALAVDQHDQLHLWETTSGYSIGQLQDARPSTHLIAISLDGSRLAAEGKDEVVRLWDVATRQCIGEMKRPQVRRMGGDPGAGRLCSLTLSPDGSQVFFGTMYSWIWAWSIDQQRVLWTEDAIPQQIHGINDLAAVGWRLVSVTPEGTLVVRDGRTGKVLKRMGRQGQDWFVGVAASDYEDIAVAVTPRSMVLFDLQSGQLIAEQPVEIVENGVINRCVLSDDATIAACSTSDGRALVWRLQWEAAPERLTSKPKPPPVPVLGDDYMLCPSCGSPQLRMHKFCMVCSSLMR